MPLSPKAPAAILKRRENYEQSLRHRVVVALAAVSPFLLATVLVWRPREPPPHQAETSLSLHLVRTTGHRALAQGEPVDGVAYDEERHELLSTARDALAFNGDRLEMLKTASIQGPPSDPEATLEKTTLENGVRAIRFGPAFSVQGNRAILIDVASVASFWDVPHQKLLWRRTFPGAAGKEPRLSPDGKYLALISRGEDTLELWDTTTVQLLDSVQLAEEDGDFTIVAFAPEGRRLFAGTSLGEIRTYEIASPASIAQRR
jgi:WD40 repeat protein